MAWLYDFGNSDMLGKISDSKFQRKSTYFRIFLIPYTQDFSISTIYRMIFLIFLEISLRFFPRFYTLESQVGTFVFLGSRFFKVTRCPDFAWSDMIAKNLNIWFLMVKNSIFCTRLTLKNMNWKTHDLNKLHWNQGRGKCMW